MRTFVVLALVAGGLFYAGWLAPRQELHQRVLRVALFIGAGIFGALLVSAILQALFAPE